MRYIGNKTRLIPFIRDTLHEVGIAPGTVHDAFAGTVAVGRALKENGWRVITSDLMTYSHVLQRAYVVAPALAFTRLLGADAGVAASVRAHKDATPGASTLDALGEFLTKEVMPRNGVVWRHFSSARGRMFFTAPNARRIDGARAQLDRWRSDALIDDHLFFVLLAAVIEGADRVANTAGVYAAFIKSWQPNALRDVRIQPIAPVGGRRGSQAYLGDAAAAARRVRLVDLLYVDPPYNGRQYSGYYHVPEAIARGSLRGTRPRGRTGLFAGDSQQSAWCSARLVRGAMRELLEATTARQVLVSYNTEGLLPEADLRALLEDHAIGPVRVFSTQYKRYRADSDHPGRRYRGDAVKELLYHARLR